MMPVYLYTLFADGAAIRLLNFTIGSKIIFWFDRTLRITQPWLVIFRKVVLNTTFYQRDTFNYCLFASA